MNELQAEVSRLQAEVRRLKSEAGQGKGSVLVSSKKSDSQWDLAKDGQLSNSDSEGDHCTAANATITLHSLTARQHTKAAF